MKIKHGESVGKYFGRDMKHSHDFISIFIFQTQFVKKLKMIMDALSPESKQLA